jgi:hypothetical protein
VDRPESGQSEIQTRLHDLAIRLREAEHLDPDSQRALAELVDELTRALGSTNLPPAEVVHLAESTAHLADALRSGKNRGILAKARDRLNLAVSNAETHAPTAVGVARRLLDTLANLGI